MKYVIREIVVLFLLFPNSRGLTVPSLEKLHAVLPSAAQPTPLVVDTVLDSGTKPRDGRLTLFRERNGWCPYSERVFLALEVKGIDYDTFLVDNMGARPAWFGGTTPQVRWPDGNQLSESMDIVYKLDDIYPQCGSKLNGPPGREPEVQRLASLFKSTFPRNTRPSSRSAFLFYSSGQPVFRSEFEKTLQRADALLAETAADGHFFLGEHFTAADVAWAPFLERYNGQLPVLHQ